MLWISIRKSDSLFLTLWMINKGRTQGLNRWQWSSKLLSSHIPYFPNPFLLFIHLRFPQAKPRNLIRSLVYYYQLDLLLRKVLNQELTWYQNLLKLWKMHTRWVHTSNVLSNIWQLIPIGMKSFMLVLYLHLLRKLCHSLMNPGQRYLYPPISGSYRSKWDGRVGFMLWNLWRKSVHP